MRPWTDDRPGGDIMGPAVTRATSAKPTTPPLKNGYDIRASGYLIAVGSRTARFRRKYKNKLMSTCLALLILILFCIALIMAILYAKLKRHSMGRICETKECLRSAANLALSMDSSANPCHDFYQYTCGNWAEDHPRPDAYLSFDWFRDKQTKVYSMVRDFLSKNTTYEPRPVQQAKDMYDACMDTEKIDKRGLKPVIQFIKTLGLPAYPTYVNISEDFDYASYNFDWLETVIKVKTLLGMDVFIGFDVFTDPKNSSVYRLVMGSPETTNPFPSINTDRKRHAGRRSMKNVIGEKTIDRPSIINIDHYLEAKEHKADDSEEKLAQIYKLFYAQLIKLFLLESGDAKDKLTEIELDSNILAAASEYYTFNDKIYDLDADNSTEETEESLFNIPEYTADEIQALTDSAVEADNSTTTLIWKIYLNGIFNVSHVTLDFDNDKVLVSDLDKKYMEGMATIIAKTPPVVLELYIWVKVVEVMSAHTTSELRILFQRSYNEMHQRGDTGSPPRSLQCASAVNDMLGMAVAYGVADPRFVTITKPKIAEMLKEMKYALARLVGRAKWMDDDTKLATYQKIIQMKTLIGFPDWLHEEGKLEEYYEGVQIDNGLHLENMINLVQVKVRRVLNKFREGNNFTWATDPTEVNAYHTFQENTITVPLVMLQYPFFDLGLDSLNYGSLGTVLGHEITHGFDNFGRKFDKDGNLLPWWSNDTIVSFVNMTQCFVDQYSSFYLPELNEHVDGKKTLGENIADNGGVREALWALREHLRKHGPEKKLPGFEQYTSEQLFFLSFGNLWCGVSTKDSLQSDLSDEHSPQRFRAQGALQNSEEFTRAWHCPPGSPMNPRKRCVIF